MTALEILYLLDEVKPFIIVPKGLIDKEHPKVKEFIRAYKEVTGKRLGEGQCKNCIIDAFFEWKTMSEKELEFMTMERKYKLKSDRVVGFNGNHYTLANITDEVAIEMVKFNVGHAKSFDNGDELLKAIEEPTDVIEQPKKRGRKPKAK